VPAAIAPGVTNPIWISDSDATSEAHGIVCNRIPSELANPAAAIARRLKRLVG